MGIQITRGTSSSTSTIEAGLHHENGHHPASVSFAQIMADMAIVSISPHARDKGADEHDRTQRERGDVQGLSLDSSVVPLFGESARQSDVETTGARAVAINSIDSRVASRTTIAHRGASGADSEAASELSNAPNSLNEARRTMPDRRDDTPSVESALAMTGAGTADSPKTLYFLAAFNRLTPSVPRLDHQHPSTRQGAIDKSRLDVAGRQPTRDGLETSLVQLVEPSSSFTAPPSEPTAGSLRARKELASALGALHGHVLAATTSSHESSRPGVIEESWGTGAPEAFVRANSELLGALSRPVSNGDGSYSIRVQIYPRELGTVDALVRVHGDAVEVQLSASTEAGRATLNAHVQAIHEALFRGHGSLEVHIHSTQRDGSGQQQRGAEGETPHRDARHEDDNDDDPSPVVL
jgi:flagellar hook-length control protein FliK